MTDPISNERLAEMLAGLEGVTPGPWYQTGAPWFRSGDGVLAGSPDGNIAFLIADTDDFAGGRDEYEGFPLGDKERDAAHIARCDPDTIRSLIEEVQASRRQSPAGVEVKPSAILSQIALWSDDEGLELSMSQGNDLVRRIMSVVRAAGISEQMLIDAFIRGESWRKRNDVDRYVAVPEMVNKAARDYADAALSSERQSNG